MLERARERESSVEANWVYWSNTLRARLWKQITQKVPRNPPVKITNMLLFNTSVPPAPSSPPSLIVCPNSSLKMRRYRCSWPSVYAHGIAKSRSYKRSSISAFGTRDRVGMIDHYYDTPSLRGLLQSYIRLSIMHLAWTA